MVAAQVSISGTTQLTGLLGSPVSHSASPAVHSASFAQAGKDAVYLAFDVTSEELQDAVRGLTVLGAAGFNVTMPHKIHVMDYLDDFSDAAALIGACNTVKIEEDGRCIGHNTDGAGFVMNLRVHGFDPTGKKVTIIGAGGAGSAIITQIALDKATRIDVFNRDDEFLAPIRERAVRITEKTGTPVSVTDLAHQDTLAQSIAEADIVINATSVGMGTGDDAKQSIVNPDFLRPDLVVADVVYHPRQTQLLQDAEAKGCTCITGIGMMIYQAAIAEEIWFGIEMPVAYIEKEFFS